MRLYLGTHMPSWLADVDVPLFVSHRRLKRQEWLPVPRGIWALDSGAFTEINDFGHYRTTPDEYVSAVHNYMAMGGLQWAAPQDWPCEPWVVAKTGLSVAEHQYKTIISFLELRDAGPFIPVLQGWTLDQYLDHVALYEEAHVDLWAYPVVGLGSVCRRQATDEIATIVRELAALGLSLHGFGVKTTGLRLYGELLTSADSMAWSYQARRNPRLPGCIGHRRCNNCWRYARHWRQRILDAHPYVTA